MNDYNTDPNPAIVFLFLLGFVYFMIIMEGLTRVDFYGKTHPQSKTNIGMYVSGWVMAMFWMIMYGIKL